MESGLYHRPDVPCQAMNYIKSSRPGSATGMKPREVINQWKDYLSMCEKEGKDTKDEMLYRPIAVKAPA